MIRAAAAQLRPRVTLRVIGFPRWAYLALWAIALLPRLIVAQAFLDAPITLSDMLQYDMLARSIEEGRGYRWYAAADVERFRDYLSLMVDVSKLQAPPEGLVTTFRAPGYPVALAAVYAFASFDARVATARLAQAALMATIAPLSAAVALAAGGRPRTATLAGIGGALYPILIFYPAALASENLFVPLTGLAFLVTLRAGRRPGIGPVVAAGIFLGIAMLTRGTLAPFVALAALWLRLVAKRPWRDVLLMTVIAFGLCLPWSLRNSRLMRGPAFVETTLGYNLYVGYHPGGNGGFVQDVAIPPMMILDDAERDRVTREAALGFIRSDPAEALGRIVRRGAYLAGVEDRELLFFYNIGYFGELPPGQRWLAYTLMVLPWLVCAALGAIGLITTPRRDAAWLAVALVAGLAVAPLLVLAEPRFHLPMVPVLVGFAAIALEQRAAAGKMLRGKRGIRFALTMWSVLALLALLWGWGYAMNWDRLMAIMGPGGHALLLPY